MTYRRYMYPVRAKKPTGQRYASFSKPEIDRLIEEAHAKGYGYGRGWHHAGSRSQWAWLEIDYRGLRRVRVPASSMEVHQ